MRKYIFIFFFCAVQIATAEPYTVKWGLIIPLSGATARAGIDIQRGFKIALADHKKTQVIHEFVFEDSQYKNREAVTSAQKLFSVDKVDIIVALWETADGVAPLADRLDKLHTSIRWNSNIADKFENTFTFESTYRDYANTFVHLFKTLGIQKISILNHESNGWNLARDAFIEKAKEEGLSIVNNQSYLPTESDFKTYAIRALKDNPEIVLVNDVGENLEQITKQLRVINPQQRVTGYLGYPLDLSLFEKEYYTGQLSLDPVFSKRYETEYGEPVYARAQLAYDLFMIVASVYDGFSSKPDTRSVVEKLKTIDSYNGMSGRIVNTNNGKVFRTQCNIMQILEGKRVTVENIQPIKIQQKG